MMKVEWESTNLLELDISATDLSTECLVDMLVRIPGLKFLAAGQINGFNDTVSIYWNVYQENNFCFKKTKIKRPLFFNVNRC